MFSQFCFYVLLYYFGACLGSFLYCLAGQWVHQSFHWDSRSSCDRCGHQLHWYELLPIFSFVLSRRKCRFCQSPIAWGYILSETGTSLLFGTMGVLLYNSFSTSLSIYYLMVFSLLLLMSFCDLQDRWVPDVLQICLLLVIAFYRGHLGMDQPFYFTYALSFSLLLGLLYLIAPHWIGGADIKLLAILSFAVPPLSVPYLLFTASFSAFLYLAVVSLIFRKQLIHLPFIPFISLSFYIVGIILTHFNF